MNAKDVAQQNYTFIVMHEPGGGWSIMFPDLPGVMSYAETWDEVGTQAHDALETWAEGQLEMRGAIPEPREFEAPEWGWETVRSELLTTKDMAQQLGVSERQVRARAKQRGIGIRVGERMLLFRPEDVAALQPGPVGRPARALAVSR